MTDTQYPPREFELRMTSPKRREQVATEMHNGGGVVGFKIYPKAWDENDRLGDSGRCDVHLSQHEFDDDDDVEPVVMTMASNGHRLQRSVNLPSMMSPTLLSPPPVYVPSQEFSQSMPALNGDSPFKGSEDTPYVCSYQKAIDENPLSPTTEIRRTQCERVIDEIIATEHAYVTDLSQIISGYQESLLKVVEDLGVSDEDMMAFFNNIEEIKDFNEFQLKSLQNCKDDVKQIAQCFIDIWEKDEGSKIYSDYCTKYPRAVEVWGKFAKDVKMTNFFKRCQQKLGHMLPLCAYLLKPVQRVLKYYLLLEKINACLTTGDNGKDEIVAAVATMTEVGEQINEVKKQYEATVKIQEIQAQLDGWEGDDLTTYGDLVCQDTFRYLGGKPANASIRLTTERYLFLFQRLLLMTKKKEDRFICKLHIKVSDMQVQGNITKYPSCFQIRQISTTRVFTFQARTMSLKDEWVKVISKILVRSVVDAVDMDMPNREKLLCFAGMQMDNVLGLSPDPGKKKRHATLDVAASKKIQKSSSFRRQSTPYDHHKSKPVHHGRADSPDEGLFRNRAHTTASTDRTLQRASNLLRHEKRGYSHLPNATKRKELEATSPSPTTALRSKSVHSSPITDDKDIDNTGKWVTRRSSDITSPTLLDVDDDEAKMSNARFDFSESKHRRKNAIKRRSVSPISPPPVTSPTSVSSDEHVTRQEVILPLPVAELADIRCLSQQSNYTSVSSVGSFDDLILAVGSPDPVPLTSGSPLPVVDQFPSGLLKLHLDTPSPALSTSDIFVDTNNSTNNNPAIFVDVFDTPGDDELSQRSLDGVVPPMAGLCTTGEPLDDTMMPADMPQVNKVDGTSTVADVNTTLGPDINILSQEILQDISTIGMTINEELFTALPDECSPVVKRRRNTNSVLSNDNFTPQNGNSPDLNSNRSIQPRSPYMNLNNSIHNGLGVFPSADVPTSNELDKSHFPAGVDDTRSSPRSSPTSRHRYQANRHQHSRKMAEALSSKSPQISDHVQSRVHSSPPLSHHSGSPKFSKQRHSNIVDSHPLHSSQDSPKLESQKRHSSPQALQHQWREMSPQHSDEPNEEFILPPPPQFQNGHNDITSDSQNHIRTPQISKHPSSIQEPSNGQSLSPKQKRALKGDRHNRSASHIYNLDDGDEEVLLTDMLKSLDQMAAEKYRQAMHQRDSTKAKHHSTSDGKSEKSEKKKSKKKSAKRRSTVGIFSFDDLIKQSIKEGHTVTAEEYSRDLRGEEKAVDDSKVRKLAREYSKRVKDRPVFNLKKRFSVHSYENFSDSEPNTPELKPTDPSWKSNIDSKRELQRGQPQVAGKRLATIPSGSTVVGYSTRDNVSETLQPSSPKLNQVKNSPVARSSSPVRSRIEGFEKLSQSDIRTLPRKSESANPIQFPARGKSFASSKSHENLPVLKTSNPKPAVVSNPARDKNTNLSVKSRELSKSYGSLTAQGINTHGSSKSYRGLSVFSPDSIDESDVIYDPTTSDPKDEFENIRHRGGFKGWVKNLVDKFSSK